MCGLVDPLLKCRCVLFCVSSSVQYREKRNRSGGKDGESNMGESSRKESRRGRGHGIRKEGKNRRMKPQGAGTMKGKGEREATRGGDVVIRGRDENSFSQGQIWTPASPADRADAYKTRNVILNSRESFCSNHPG